MKRRIDVKSLLLGVGLGTLLALAAIAVSQRSKPASSSLNATQQKPPDAISPGTAGQLTTAAPRSYEFGTGPGRRVWQRTEADTWLEVYPDGLTSTFKVLGRTRVGESDGTVVAKVAGDEGRTATANDGSLQAFIPDKGSQRMHHWFRNTSRGDTEWHDLAAMNKVQ